MDLTIGQLCEFASISAKFLAKSELFSYTFDKINESKQERLLGNSQFAYVAVPITQCLALKRDKHWETCLAIHGSSFIVFLSYHRLNAKKGLSWIY